MSQATGLNFGNLTLVVYCLFVVAQFIIKGKNRQWIDVLQVPLSIVLTRFMNLFAGVIPYKNGNMPADLALLVVAIIFTGVGAAMTVAMQLIPNPGDGIAGTISRISGKELGFCKNCFDLGCVTISLLIGLCFGNLLLGVGLGTLISMVGVGRAIAAFNYLCKKPLLRITGMD